MQKDQNTLLRYFIKRRNILVKIIEIIVTVLLKDSYCLYIHTHAHTYKVSVTPLKTNLVPVNLERAECENHLDRIDT